MRHVLVALLLAASLAGCIADTPEPPLAPMVDESEPAVPRPVVVAVIDTGINVYHQTYQRDTSLSDEVLATFVNTLDGQAPQRVNVSQTGDYEARLEADKDVWANLTDQTLYHFEGTNVLGISFDTGDEHPVLDDGSHGTGTTGAVLAVDPNVIVVLIEGISPDSEAWAAMQPWIDVVSMSYGPPGSGPKTGPLLGLTTSEATKLMWANGKLPIGAADNSPALATFDETAGPPWVIGVAGDHDTACREYRSGNLPDFTSDFTQDLPRADSIDENRSMSGTSFATPRTAGSFASALRTLRDTYGAPPAAAEPGVLAYGPENGTITNQDLRAAFEQSARYIDTVVTCGPGMVNPVAPWTQQGWGHVGPEVVADAVAVFTGEHDVPEKPGMAKDWNGHHMTVRKTYWRS